MADTNKTIRRERETTDGPGPDAEEQGASEVLQKAQGWAGVAREAHDDCQKGLDAEEELRRRRNRSGQ